MIVKPSGPKNIVLKSFHLVFPYLFYIFWRLSIAGNFNIWTSIILFSSRFFVEDQAGLARMRNNRQFDTTDDNFLINFLKQHLYFAKPHETPIHKGLNNFHHFSLIDIFSLTEFLSRWVPTVPETLAYGDEEIVFPTAILPVRWNFHSFLYSRTCSIHNRFKFHQTL